MSAPTFETLTVSTTALQFTAATFAGKNRAVITTLTDTCRYRVDGTDPTAAVGHQLAAGSTLILESAQEIANFSVIRSGTSDVPLSVTFTRRSAARN